MRGTEAQGFCTQQHADHLEVMLLISTGHGALSPSQINLLSAEWSSANGQKLQKEGSRGRPVTQVCLS